MAFVKIACARPRSLPAYSMRSTLAPSLVHFSTLQKLYSSASSGLAY